MTHKEVQLPVATGVTDGTMNPWKLIEDLTDVIRHTPSRNDVIEEIALELEKFTFAFGVDTVDSFTAFIRGLKE